MARRGRSGEAGSERRQAILQAALAVFNAKGLAAATMDDIRAQSGASTGSIYHHFPGKEQLIAALYVEGYQALHGEMRAALAGAPPAAAGVRGIVAAYLGWFERSPALGRFLLAAAGTEQVAAAAGAMLRDAAELEAL
ncbi:MAG TPA: helix-turn-helix domain-containing protein, partial [Herpetosiphonaceae bacterium]